MFFFSQKKKNNQRYHIALHNCVARNVTNVPDASYYITDYILDNIKNDPKKKAVNRSRPGRKNLYCTSAAPAIARR
jgi:hypothetical protein